MTDPMCCITCWYPIDLEDQAWRPRVMCPNCGQWQVVVKKDQRQETASIQDAV